MPTDWVFDDGGQPAVAGNCVPRAIAIACAQPYADVLASLNAHGANRDRAGNPDAEHYGMSSTAITGYLGARGWRWVLCARVHHPATQLDDLPGGRLLVLVCGHLMAVIDNTIHDLGDFRASKRGGSSLPVYGYYYHRQTERAARAGRSGPVDL